MTDKVSLMTGESDVTVKLLPPAIALPVPLVLGKDERRAVEASEDCELMLLAGIGCDSEGDCLEEDAASPACLEEADKAVTAAFCAALVALLSLARNLLVGGKVALGEGVV